jgi:hypothetical protein
MGFTELGDPFVRSYLILILFSDISRSPAVVGWACA